MNLSEARSSDSQETSGDRAFICPIPRLRRKDFKLTMDLDGIFKLLHDADWIWARQAAVNVIGPLSAEERALLYIEGVGELLSDPDSSVRRAAVVLIGRAGAKERAPHLRCVFERLHDADFRVRQAAVDVAVDVIRGLSAEEREELASRGCWRAAAEP